MKTPHKCPVCEGRGTVNAGFYSQSLHPSAINTMPETCRTCRGIGVVFTDDTRQPEGHVMYGPTPNFGPSQEYPNNFNEEDLLP